jgi:serine/threonine-protein kinase
VNDDGRVDTLFAGRYEIESRLGQGGMGSVYRAWDRRLSRWVAIKFPRAELAEDPQFRRRFLHESLMAAAIEHRNIIPIHDAGEADGALYITMRCVEGASLADRLRQGGPMGQAQVLSVVTQVGDALDAAHAKGLVHRDVKPANVLLASREGSGQIDEVYLVDFGLTKRASSQTLLTAAGGFVGTLDYIAPEQIDADLLGGAQLDGRADIYSLGCLLYECVTGQPPFAGRDHAQLIYAHLTERAPRVTDRRPELGPAVDEVVARAMAKVRDERFSSGRELSEALRRALGRAVGSSDRALKPPPPDRGEATIADRASNPPPSGGGEVKPTVRVARATRQSPPGVGRGGRLVAAVVVVLVLLSAGLGVRAFLGRGSPAPAPVPSPAATSAAPVPAGQESRVLRVDPRVMQDRNWADPAVLETWLVYDGAGRLPANDADAQRALWAYEGAHNGGFQPSQWQYSPFAVATTFNDLGGRTRVGDAPFDDSNSAGVAIVDSVYRRNEPVIALVDRANMYVLIVGVTLGPGGLSSPPDSVVVDDPWPVSKWGPVRNDGTSAAFGLNARMTWPQFLAHFSRVPQELPGVWANRYVLVAPGLPVVT